MMAVGEPLREKRVRTKIDENLITRIGRDDRDALEELYRLTERTLYSYVLAWTWEHPSPWQKVLLTLDYTRLYPLSETPRSLTPA